MKKIRIIELKRSWTMAGPESLILSVAKKINKVLFDPLVITFGLPKTPSQPTLYQIAKSINLKAVDLPSKSKYNPSIIAKVLSLIKEYDINIIHTHDFKSNLIGLITALLYKKPLITTIHGRLSTPFRVRIYESIDSLLIRFFDKVVVGSNDLKEKLIKKWKISPQKIELIHNSVDILRFNLPLDSDRIKAEFKIKEDEIIVTTIGQLKKEKGVEYLLAAVPKVIEKFKEVRFLICGEGEYKEELIKLAEKLNITKNVIFTGYYDDLSQVLGVSDLFITPSLMESLPIVILEAMCAGLPIIGTKVGDIPFCINSKNGLLIKPKSSEEISKALIKLLTNKEKLKEMGKESRNLVKEKFSDEVMVKKIEGIYLSLINSRVSHGR
ncbi:glycosyltransferase family 4 protein [bacterium]|nr:glycosyltransferase family 4 protein [bacterium]MBU1782624.1 glycosyltransferase family 4 protein [bacterium]MBU2599605.1 glycosyltransferase family 4 protein [bacterium]